MSELENLHEFTNRVFVDYCTKKFGWKDLSREVIMDLGCGELGYCAKALLKKFPDVGIIIAVDACPNAVRRFRESCSTDKIECVIANIEQRESLQNYEGKMAKLLSSYVFHQLTDKELAFRNVFHLLKPGGDAGILLIKKSSIYDWMTEVLKIPKWKEAFQGHHVEDMYDETFGIIQYREMVQKIGFKVVVGREENRVIPCETDKICKDSLYHMCKEEFKISPEQLEEFQEECFQLHLKISPRDSQGKPCYRTIELYLLLSKPSDDSVTG